MVTSLLVPYFSNNQLDAIILSGNIYADNIVHNRADLRPTKDISFHGQYNATSSTYTMGLHRLTITPKAGDPVGTNVGSMTGSKAATFTYNFTATETEAGNIYISRGDFAMDTAGSMTLNLVDLTTTIPTAAPDVNGFSRRELPVFHAGDGGSINLISDTNVTFNIVSSTNPAIQWSYTNGRIIQQVQVSTPQNIINAAQGQVSDDPSTQQNLELIAESLSELTNDLLIAAGGVAQGARETLARLNADITEVTEHAQGAFQVALQTVSERISSVSLPGALGSVFNVADNVDDNTASGISAGEEIVGDRHGVWGSYSLYSAHQQQLNGRPGYRSTSHTVTVGVDTMPMEDITLGVSLSFNRAFIRHKNTNRGDKSDTNSYIGTIYGMKEFANNWFIQGVGIYSHTKVKNCELRGSSINREIARANFDANSYGGELLAGYNYLTKNQTLIVPMVGLEYQRLSKTSYQEYGTRNQNLTVRKSPDEKLDGVIGVRFVRNYRVYGYDLTPEIHGYIRHDLLNDKVNIEARLPDLTQPLVARGTAEENRTFYNVGGSITGVISSNTKMSLSYDSYLAKKHHAK